MPVQIHITGENAQEAIRELSVLATHLSLSASISVSNLTAATAEVPTTVTTKVDSVKTSEKQTRNRTAGSKQVDADPVKVDPSTTSNETDDNQVGQSEDEGPTVENTSSTEDDSTEITAADLRAKATAVAQAGKQAQVKALLVEFEAANISTIPENKRLAFYKALEAIE